MMKTTFRATFFFCLIYLWWKTRVHLGDMLGRPWRGFLFFSKILMNCFSFLLASHKGSSKGDQYHHGAAHFLHDSSSSALQQYRRDLSVFDSPALDGECFLQVRRKVLIGSKERTNWYSTQLKEGRVCAGCVTRCHYRVLFTSLPCELRPSGFGFAVH